MQNATAGSWSTIYGPLSAGARVIVAQPGAERDGGLLVETIAANDVTVLQIVPSVLDALLEEPGIGRCCSVKHIFCGGEALTPGLRERIFAHLAAELHNLYGPTEATIDATYWTCRRGEDRPVVPIGRPIANAKIYILDDRLHLAPVGVPGELYIGGAGVARGYLNRPDLTAERFIPDSFGGGSGARLYRSGDRARWLPDGSIEFLGRLDGQVKVRGFRIEPGEIESVLARHPMVRQAAVAACGGAPEGRRLVAFVAGEERVPDADELSGFLRKSLPRHMLPSAFVMLDDLPRTPNGKVDRRALAVKDPPLPEREKPSVAPRDAVELQLVRIWESLFPGQTVGVTDDFFELGGHSLLAMRLAVRVGKVFDKELPVSSLMQGRTIEQLARLLPEPPVTRSPLVAIQPAGPRRPFFCVHPVGGSVFRYVELARWLGKDRPFYGLEARGLDEEEQPHARIEDMAAYYLEAVRAVQPEGPYLLGGWSMGGVIAFEMARQIETQARHMALPVLIDAGGAIASLRGPEQQEQAQHALLRAFVLSLGLSPDQFTISMQELQQMGSDEQLACVLAQPGIADLLPPEMDVTGLRRQLSVFTANLRAMQSYVPQPFGGRIALLEAAESPGAASGDSFLAWEELAGQGVTRTTVPGNHYTMLREPCVRHLARNLADCLEEAETTIL